MLERQLPYSDKFGTDISDPRIGLHAGSLGCHMPFISFYRSSKKVIRGLRPALRSAATDAPEVREELKGYMQRAWSPEPDLRPDFEAPLGLRRACSKGAGAMSEPPVEEPEPAMTCPATYFEAASLLTGSQGPLSFEKRGS